MGLFARLQSFSRRLTQDTVLMVALLLLTSVGLWAVAKSLPGGSTTALGMLWCLSCLVVGLLGGFLFAIPRVPTSRRSDDKKGSGGSETHDTIGLGINTNLEEISDWLTKILVGIGLVEAKTLKSYLGSAGRYIGRSLGVNGDVLAVGLVIYFLCLGLLTGFLATRLFISPSLRRADAETEGMKDAEKLAQEAKDQSDATPELYDVLDAAYAAWMDFSKNEEKPENETTRSVESKAGDHLRTLKPVLPPELALSYLNEFNKFYEQPRWLLNRRLHTLMANFYADTRNFSDAIRVITRFINEKRKHEQFDIHLAAGLYNRACYRARIALLTTEESVRSKQMTLGLEDLEEDVKICASDAEQARQDPDFALWRTHPRFTRILDSNVRTS